MNVEREAFFAVCPSPVEGHRHYVTLYVDLPFYGGPEEGGWWGSDTELVAYQEVATDVEAKQMLEAVKAKVEELNKQARQRFNEQCARECEWLEERGLDDDYLREPDGDERYWMTTEERPGEHASQGDRFYS